MRKIIILHKEDLFYNKRSHPDFDIKNPSIHDFNITREDINKSEFIFYIYKDDENPNKVIGKAFKEKYPEDYYDDLKSMFLSEELDN